MQEAGAAAIELNIYFVPGDPHTSGRDVEDRHVEILQPGQGRRDDPGRREAEPALQLDRARWRCGSTRAGADGLVLFNRFLQPDVDPETLAVTPALGLSAPAEARLPRAWIAILRGHVTAPSPPRPASRMPVTSPPTCSPAPTSS